METTGNDIEEILTSQASNDGPAMIPVHLAEAMTNQKKDARRSEVFLGAAIMSLCAAVVGFVIGFVLGNI
jgi:hypothetical protein